MNTASTPEGEAAADLCGSGRGWLPPSGLPEGVPAAPQDSKEPGGRGRWWSLQQRLLCPPTQRKHFPWTPAPDSCNPGLSHLFTRWGPRRPASPRELLSASLVIKSSQVALCPELHPRPRAGWLHHQPSQSQGGAWGNGGLAKGVFLSAAHPGHLFQVQGRWTPGTRSHCHPDQERGADIRDASALTRSMKLHGMRALQVRS